MIIAYRRDGGDANNKAWRLINATPENGVEGLRSSRRFSILDHEDLLNRRTSAKLCRAGLCSDEQRQYVRDDACGGTVLTFAGGELLFRGASGAINNDDGRWRLLDNFSAQKNETISIDGFDSFTKRGWDYLELKTIGDTITSGDYKFPVRKPTLMIVHVVYEYSDLRDLGI